MDEIREQQAGELRIRIVRPFCVGYGECIAVAPDAFAFGEDGICSFVDGADEVERERLMDACRACPVDALEVRDADGRQLVP